MKNTNTPDLMGDREAAALLRSAADAAFLIGLALAALHWL